MSLETRITALATTIAAEVNTINSNAGDLTALGTANKASLVAALNELHTELDAINAATINDASGSSTTETWSIDKISSEISAATAALIDGAPAALDTLNELAAALNDDAGVINDILTAQGLRVRVDAAQAFTTLQKDQGCDNIGAQKASEIGNPDRDFANDFTTALT